MTTSDGARNPSAPTAAGGTPASSEVARTSGSVERRPVSPPARSAGRPTQAAPPRREPPRRPTLEGKQAPPVIVQLPPPVAVRLSIIAWVLSLIVGGIGVIYLFVIRTSQLPEITAIIQSVDSERPDETHELAADIIFWVVFGILVAIILLQILFLVALTNRRPRTRWWQFGSLVLLGVTYLVSQELVAIGTRGVPLTQILLLQLGLGALALLFSFLPAALRWSGRRHDVVGGPQAPSGGEF